MKKTKSNDIKLIFEELKKINNRIEKIEIKMNTVHESIIQFKDDILKEIIDLRDDVTVVTGYRDMIEDHKQRIGKLEKTVSQN